MELEKGTRIKNRYEIIELLGKGGFGETYKAMDHLLNRVVAMKCSETSLAHEAKIMRALQNVPNISHLYDYFTVKKNHYIVMKLIKGQSLEAIRKENGGSIKIQLLKKMLPSVLITLEQMHDRGIIHRDISPGNFLVGEEDRCYLIDFGSATSIKESSLFNKQVFAHQGLDAPESGKVSEQGPWTDVYSLCVSILFLLSGEGIPAPEHRVPYDPVPGMLSKLSLTAKMQNALVKGLSLEKTKRHQSIQAFAKEFLGGRDSSEVSGESYSVHYHARTDIGYRDVNQDNFMVDTKFAYSAEDCEIKGYMECEPEEWHVVAVADGVAGANHGELASRAAIQAVSHFVDYYREDSGLHENLIEELLNQLNEKIVSLGEIIGKTASTISIMLWKDHQYCIANIGDSPVYRLSKGHLEQLSKEHTVAREKIEAGEQPSVREFHVLSKYLGKKGIAGSEMAYIQTGEISPGDIFMICSDGISGVLTEQEKVKYMKADGDKAISKIFTRAHKHPQMDNCTAIILKFHMAEK